MNFRKWLELEDQKKKVLEATERSDFPDRMFAYLSVAFDFVDEKVPWENTVFLFMESLKFQPNRKLPLIKDSPNKDEKPADWDYEGRTWPYWSHLISKAYGWTLEYIADLEVDEALARVQEIMTDDQLEKEFVYGLSEIAYPYNKSTKQSNFKPLKRPYWMLPKVAPVRTTKFRRDVLPMGLVQDVSGMPESMNPLRGQVEVIYKKKEANPPPGS